MCLWQSSVPSPNPRIGVPLRRDSTLEQRDSRRAFECRSFSPLIRVVEEERCLCEILQLKECQRLVVLLSNQQQYHLSQQY